MKNTILLLFLSTILVFSCGKSSDKPSSQLPSKAETKPQYDHTSFGVYKGVIIGSSGYIVFRINNGDNVIKGYLSIDNKKDTLSTSQTLIAGQRIVDLKFTGRFSSMTLNADSDGQGAEISDIKIDGHPGNVAGIVVHEESTRQVFCYEGTFSGSEQGTFNCTKIGAGRGDSSIGGSVDVSMAAKFTLDTLYIGYGYLHNNEIATRLYNFVYFRDNNFTIQGKFDKETFSGTWNFSEVYGKGTFNCVRTY